MRKSCVPCEHCWLGGLIDADVCWQGGLIDADVRCHHSCCAHCRWGCGPQLTRSTVPQMRCCRGGGRRHRQLWPSSDVVGISAGWRLVHADGVMLCFSCFWVCGCGHHARFVLVLLPSLSLVDPSAACNNLLRKCYLLQCDALCDTHGHHTSRDPEPNRQPEVAQTGGMRSATAMNLFILFDAGVNQGMVVSVASGNLECDVFHQHYAAQQTTLDLSL